MGSSASRRIFLVCLFAFSASAQAQQAAVKDESPHRTQFIAVEQGVKLEVLDWGAHGRPLILLAGLGVSAHEFDEFAPKLAKHFRVFGITRRGFGASSQPPVGYDIQRLAMDITVVSDTLKLKMPLIVGHSISGQELSVLGAAYPTRVSGLVYMDAAFDYSIRMPQEYEALLSSIMPDSPALKFNADERPQSFVGVSPNLQILYSTAKPDYEHIEVPALAIVAVPIGPGAMFADYETRDRAARAVMERMFVLNLENVRNQEKMFADGVRHARVFEIVGARHDIYRSNEKEVVDAIVRFSGALRP